MLKGSVLKLELNSISCDKCVNNNPIALNNVNEIKTFKTKFCNYLLQVFISRKLDTDNIAKLYNMSTQTGAGTHTFCLYSLSG